MTKWHPATKLLLLAAFLAVPYMLWTSGADQATGVAASVARVPASETALATVESPPAQFILPPLEQFTAVVERPLFSPTRRMPAPPPASVPDAPATIPQAPRAAGPAEPELRFFGTVRQGGVAAALVTYSATAEVARLQPGDPVGEWQVIAVERNRLELGLGQERRTFEIFGSGLRNAPSDEQSPVADEVEDTGQSIEPYAGEGSPELE